MYAFVSSQSNVILYFATLIHASKLLYVHLVNYYTSTVYCFCMVCVDNIDMQFVKKKDLHACSFPIYHLSTSTVSSGRSDFQKSGSIG